MRIKQFPNHASKFQKLVALLNEQPTHKVIFTHELLVSFRHRAHSPMKDEKLMKQYLYLMAKGGYIYRDGYGSQAVVLRMRKIPTIVIKTKVEDYDDE